MPLDFPNSPTNGQIFTSGIKKWQWSTAEGAWLASNYAPSPENVNGIVKSDGAGNFSAAVAGTDYLTSADLAGQITTATYINSSPTSLSITTSPAVLVAVFINCCTNLTISSGATTVFKANGETMAGFTWGRQIVQRFSCPGGIDCPNGISVTGACTTGAGPTIYYYLK